MATLPVPVTPPSVRSAGRRLGVVDPVVSALAQQQAELSEILEGLADDQWGAPTRCEGWDVSDVVLHLCQTNDMATASAEGRFESFFADVADGTGPASTIDEGAAALVAKERGLAPSALFQRWSGSAAAMLAALDSSDMSRRVRWVVGELSLRTLATTRLAETWIHTGDVAGAVGVELAPTERLEPIARLAWRTLPYAFSSAGRKPAGPVAFRLTSPGGLAWEFTPDEPATTTIRGPAVDLCNVAARRVDPASTRLEADGPDGADVLMLVRTYA